MEYTVYIGLGGNVGDTAILFECALSALEMGGLRDIVCSQHHRTKAVGCPEGTPDFLNAVARGRWGRTALDLLDLCQSIEVACGRPADHPHWVSRTLDLDILLFGDEVIDTPRLRVPHPLMNSRAFVMLPLREVLLP